MVFAAAHAVGSEIGQCGEPHCRSPRPPLHGMDSPKAPRCSNSNVATSGHCGEGLDIVNVPAGATSSHKRRPQGSCSAAPLGGGHKAGAHKGGGHKGGGHKGVAVQLISHGNGWLDGEAMAEGGAHGGCRACHPPAAARLQSSSFGHRRTRPSCSGTSGPGAGLLPCSPYCLLSAE